MQWARARSREMICKTILLIYMTILGQIADADSNVPPVEYRLGETVLVDCDDGSRVTTIVDNYGGMYKVAAQPPFSLECFGYLRPSDLRKANFVDSLGYRSLKT